VAIFIGLSAAHLRSGNLAQESRAEAMSQYLAMISPLSRIAHENAEAIHAND
jgi:hypothetical protein